MTLPPSAKKKKKNTGSSSTPALPPHLQPFKPKASASKKLGLSVEEEAPELPPHLQGAKIKEETAQKLKESRIEEALSKGKTTYTDPSTGKKTNIPTQNLTFRDTATGQIISRKITQQEARAIIEAGKSEAEARRPQTLEKQLEKADDWKTLTLTRLFKKQGYNAEVEGLNVYVETPEGKYTVSRVAPGSLIEGFAPPGIIHTGHKKPKQVTPTFTQTVEIGQPDFMVNESLAKEIRAGLENKAITQTAPYEISIETPVMTYELTEGAKAGIRQTLQGKAWQQTISLDQFGNKEFISPDLSRDALTQFAGGVYDLASIPIKAGKGAIKLFPITLDIGAQIKEEMQAKTAIEKKRIKQNILYTVMEAIKDEDIQATALMAGIMVAPPLINIGAGLIYGTSELEGYLKKPSYAGAGRLTFLASLPLLELEATRAFKETRYNWDTRVKSYEKGADFSLNEVGRLPALERGAVLPETQTQLIPGKRAGVSYKSFLEEGFKGLEYEKIPYDVLPPLAPALETTPLAKGKQLNIFEALVPQTVQNLRLKYGRVPDLEFYFYRDILTESAKLPKSEGLPRPTFAKFTESGAEVSALPIESQLRFKRTTELSERQAILEQLPRNPLITIEEQIKRLPAIEKRIRPKTASELAYERFRYKSSLKKPVYSSTAPIVGEQLTYLDWVKEDLFQFWDSMRGSKIRENIFQGIRGGNKIKGRQSIEFEYKPFIDIGVNEDLGKAQDQRPFSESSLKPALIPTNKVNAIDYIIPTNKIRFDLGQFQNQDLGQANKSKQGYDFRFLVILAPPQAPPIGGGTRPPKPTIPEKPPPEIFGLLPPIEKEKRGRFQDLYNVSVKERGRFIKVNKNPLPRNKALNLGGGIVDNTVSATFKISKAKKSTTRYPDDFGFFTSDKFTKRNNLYIEKNKNRIDSFGEMQGITVKGWLARRGGF